MAGVPTQSPSVLEREPGSTVFQEPPIVHDDQTYGQIIVKRGIDCFSNPYTDLHFVDQIEVGAPRVTLPISGHYATLSFLIEEGLKVKIDDPSVRFTAPNPWQEINK